MLSRIASGALVLSLLSVAACSITSESTGSSEANATEAAPVLSVIKGREYAKCWFDVSGANAAMSCTSTARGADPLAAKAKVVAVSMKNFAHSVEVPLDIEAGGTYAVSTFPRSEFPVMIMMEAQLTKEGAERIGLTKGGDLHHNPVIHAPEEASSTKPAVLGQPFDIWPVALIETRGEHYGFQLSTPEYSHATTPYEVFAADPIWSFRPELMSYDHKGKLQYVVAPAAGGIASKVSGPTSADAPIAGPGYYAWTGTALRAATKAEIEADFGPQPTTPGNSGSTTSDPGSTDGSTDLGTVTPPPEPADPDPTCGGDKQNKCANSSCDAGNRWDSPTQKCTSCGDAGKTYCFVDPNGMYDSQGKRCNAGTRWDSPAQKCTTCGDAGQTYCFLDPNNMYEDQGKRCNAGTRWDSLAQKCTTCGDAGQTYCFVDPKNMYEDQGRRCNDGLHYDSNRSSCVK